MRNKWNKRFVCLVAAAVVLAGSLSIGEAIAYFTAFDTVSGEVKLELGFTEARLNEEVTEGKKEITLTNIGVQDCYVRIKALAGAKIKDKLTYAGDDRWTQGTDGYYYYSDILPAGGTTTQIDVSFAYPEDGQDTFNVIIIQESAPVFYDEAGAPYADWDAEAEITRTIQE